LLDKINSFTLLCHHSDQIPFSPDTDETTQRSLEAYFQRDEAHTFIVNSVGNSMNRQYLQTPERTLSHFVHQFGKAKNNLGQSGKVSVFFRSTSCHKLFSNI
jgi:hypothetical protein